MAVSVAFEATVWEHEGPGSWHFATLPPDCADEIADVVEGRTSGFGSVRVDARIGGTGWQTSLFPDSRRGTYLLPVKKAVRTAEGLTDGSPVCVEIVVRDPRAD